MHLDDINLNTTHHITTRVTLDYTRCLQSADIRLTLIADSLPIFQVAFVTTTPRMPQLTSQGLLSPAPTTDTRPGSSSSASQSPSRARGASPAPARRSGGIVVFSGGSASNSLVDVFEHVRGANACTLSYVIPISDNGGSSSEIIRVFGGPGV